MEGDQDLQAELLLREFHRLETRDLQLWYTNLLVMLGLAAGFLAAQVPGVLWETTKPTLGFQYLPQLCLSFIPLILLFNGYVLQQRRTLRRSREVLSRQLLRAETAEALSLVDPLTGVFNRRFLDWTISKEMSRADRCGSNLSLMMLDLDAFKSVNTRFGHLVGDRVLRELAELLKKTLRKSDTIVRYGGDEFVALLPETNEEQAQLATERIHQAIEQWNRDSPIRGYKMGLSCGVAPCTKGASLSESLKIADERMYQEKARRRSAD